MPTIDSAAFTAALSEDAAGAVTLVDSAQAVSIGIPQKWRAIAESGDAAERCRLALAQWNPDFLSMIPGYAAAMDTYLADVRVCVFDGEGTALAYAFSAGDSTAIWIGWDPASFGDAAPEFFETLPAPVQTFLREVHAGYTLLDRLGCGPVRPADMLTQAERSDDAPDDSDEYWFLDSEPIDATRMMYVTCTSYNYEIFTSPDIPPGAVLVCMDSEVRLFEDFGAQLDSMMVSGI